MNKDYKIGQLFDWNNGDTDLKKEHINGKGYPVVSSGLENMGIIGYTDVDARILPANTITVDMFGNVFYREFEYKEVTHARVFTLLPKGFELETETGLYIVSLLGFLSKVFSYNNMCSYAKSKDMTISLPVITRPDANHEYTVDDIDWDYMRERITELERDRIIELDAYLQATGLNDYELTEEDKKVLSEDNIAFGEFTLEKLFTSQTGDVDLQQKDVNGKGVFFINSGVENRGIKGKTDREAKVFPANTITIDFWGNAYYRDFEYKIATHNHVFSLSGDVIKNKAVGLYIIGKLSKLPHLFSYSNMATWNKLKVLTISLPITSDGGPDFDYMSAYIRAIEKIVIADVVKYKDRIIEETKKIVGT